MITFLALIGVVALFTFFKFIYDTYLTDNTNKRWNVYKKDFPQQAAQIENNKGLNFKTSISSEEKEQIIIRNALLENPALMNAVLHGNQNDIKNILSKNPKLFNSLMTDLAHIDEPAEKYRLTAIDLKFEGKITEAIEIIKYALTLNDKQTEPFLFKVRSDCYFALKDDLNGVRDLIFAINSLKSSLVSDSDFFNLSEFYNHLFSHYLKIEDYRLSEIYINMAIENINNLKDNYYCLYCYYENRSKLYNKMGYKDKSILDMEQSIKNYKLSEKYKKKH